MPINTTYDPQNISDFEKSKLNKAAIGFTMMTSPGTQSYLDYTLTDDVLITGSTLLVQGATIGDNVSFQVLAGPTVINQFVTTWFIDISAIKQSTPTANYPAKLPAGLTLRVVYNSIGTDPVWIAINYDLNKVLV